MNSAGWHTPNFTHPPVVEVLLAVYFEPLSLLRTVQLGLLWQEFRQRFPRVEEHAALPPAAAGSELEGIAQLGVRLEMLDVPPAPRLWFLNEAGTEVIQIQQDRLVHNWRRLEDDDQYPHYDGVRATFSKELGEFESFVDRQQLGTLKPIACEITYIDHIVSGEVWERHGQLDSVVTTWSQQYSGEPLPEPKSASFTVQYPILQADGVEPGRLTVSVAPSYRASDGKPIFVFTSTARGRPLGEGTEGVLRFLDIGHSWTVQGFLTITTEQMHAAWEAM